MNTLSSKFDFVWLRRVLTVALKPIFKERNRLFFLAMQLNTDFKIYVEWRSLPPRTTCDCKYFAYLKSKPNGFRICYPLTQQSRIAQVPTLHCFRRFGFASVATRQNTCRTFSRNWWLLTRSTVNRKYFMRFVYWIILQLREVTWRKSMTGKILHDDLMATDGNQSVLIWKQIKLLL